MKKYILLTVLTGLMICSSGLVAMDGIDLESGTITQGGQVGAILAETNPAKFKAMTSLLLHQGTAARHRARRTRTSGTGTAEVQPPTKEERLAELQRSLEQITKLSEGIVVGLEGLVQDAANGWNAARKESLRDAIGWGVSAAVPIAIEGYTIFSNFSGDSKIAISMAALPTALGTVLKFVKFAEETINNSRIETRIDAQEDRLNKIGTAKQNLENEIKALQKEIRKDERRARIRGTAGIMRREGRSVIDGDAEAAFDSSDGFSSDSNHS